MQPEDNYYMTLAIEQAKQGLYTTRPNPAVGCVIVKEGKIIGTGFHPKAGEPHAEVFALREAGMQAAGATAYVTLEPCSHTGRTPPCALALKNAGIKRVVVAGLDPNPKVAGRGIEILKQANIDVTVGIAQEPAQQLNLGFLKAMSTGLPYVRLKMAASIDGRTALASGESKWITGPASREDVQTLRALSGAIITGSQTIIDDNPSLNVRSSKLVAPEQSIVQPMVVIMDRRQRLAGAMGNRYTVFGYDNTLLTDTNDIEALLRRLVAEFQVYDVLVEAGAQVAGSFVSQNWVDELIVYQAPCLLGQSAKPMFAIDVDKLDLQKRFKCQSVTVIGADNKLVFKPLS